MWLRIRPQAVDKSAGREENEKTRFAEPAPHTGREV